MSDNNSITVWYRDEDGIKSTQVNHLNGFQGADIPDTQVLQSAAGYYIGDLYEEDGSDIPGMIGWFPNSRDSQNYWGNREDAEFALRTGKYMPKF